MSRPLPLLPESVLVTADVAVVLCQLLEPPLRWAQANGLRLATPVALTVEALQILAARPGSSGISGIPAEEVAATIPSVVTTSQMARLLGCSERNITARARRGTLPGARKTGGGGSKGAGGWVFDVAEVADLVGPSVVAVLLDGPEAA